MSVTNTPSPTAASSPTAIFTKPEPLVIFDLVSPKHTDIENLNDNIGKWTKHSEKHKSNKKHIYYHPYSGRTTPPLREGLKSAYMNPPPPPKEEVITEEGFGQGLPEFTFEALQLANLISDPF